MIVRKLMYCLFEESTWTENLSYLGKSISPIKVKYQEFGQMRINVILMNFWNCNFPPPSKDQQLFSVLLSVMIRVIRIVSLYFLVNTSEVSEFCGSVPNTQLVILPSGASNNSNLIIVT